MVKITRILLVIIIVALLVAGTPFILSRSPLHAQVEKNPNLGTIFVDDEGRELIKIIVPGRPPAVKAAVVTVPEPHIDMGINTLSPVPAFDWSYGCSATSAAMLFGYYDNDGYHTNMYDGPTNAGVCPMDNSIWGSGIGGSAAECPLSATHQGKDDLGVRGHVDDYWIQYGSTAPDPWIGSWPEHTHADCTGDFMGTNQSSFGNVDASTTFWYLGDGRPLYDYTGAEPGSRDGGHGLKLFVDSRGYNVAYEGGNYQNFNQFIYGYDGNTLGFTFAEFQAEIDAGRPVLIHVTDHTMLGYGYNTTGNIVYIHDTWDYSDHQMTWGGSYSGLTHYAVTVLRLEAVSVPTWESYKGNYGDSGGTVDDYYKEYASEHEVYMYGTGFTSGSYRVTYWDGDGDKRRTEVIPTSSSTLKSTYTFAEGDVEGNWHVTVYNQAANPDSYSSTDPNIVADDTSYTVGYAFHLEQGAIPEFPTVPAAIVALALSVGTYLWMRRKVAPAPA